jgi:hypothetical protein
MKREVAEQWVAALRSGKYKQGRNYLNSNGSYCCLGVLCDISKQGDWTLDPGASDIDFSAYSYAGESTMLLPAIVRDWAGMVDPNGAGSVKYADGITYLPTLNDMLEYSFERIANIIEQQWETI